MVFWLVGVPIIGLCTYNAYMLESKEWNHLKEHPVKTYPFPHLHMRIKVCMIS